MGAKVVGIRVTFGVWANEQSPVYFNESLKSIRLFYLSIEVD